MRLFFSGSTESSCSRFSQRLRCGSVAGDGVCGTPFFICTSRERHLLQLLEQLSADPFEAVPVHEAEVSRRDRLFKRQLPFPHHTCIWLNVFPSRETGPKYSLIQTTRIRSFALAASVLKPSRVSLSITPALIGM